MNVVLFLGAGVSRDSGLPMAKNLTERIFTECYRQDGNRGFVSGSPSNAALGQDDQTERIRKLLRVLQIHDANDITQACYYMKDSKFASSGPGNFFSVNAKY